jgi:hypothetical protein
VVFLSNLTSAETHIRPRPLPSTSFPVHYSLIILRERKKLKRECSRLHEPKIARLKEEEEDKVTTSAVEKVS